MKLYGGFTEMTTHETLVGLFNNYISETQKFEDKGIMASAGRARKALTEISRLAKVRRAEIQESKNELKASIANDKQ